MNRLQRYKKKKNFKRKFFKVIVVNKGILNLKRISLFKYRGKQNR